MDNHSLDLKEKVVSGIFWKFGERFFAQLISFIISIVLARILLPEEYGCVAIILIFISIADVFVTSGLSTSLIQKKDSNEVDFSTIFYCTFALSIVLYVFIFIISDNIASFYKMPNLSIYLKVFALKIIISSYNSIQHAFVSRHMLFKKFFFSTIIGTIISGIVGIILAINGFGVWALIGQYLTNSFIDTIVLNITVPWHPKLVFSINSAKKLFGFGWKVLLTDLIGTIFDNLRSLIIGKIYTASDLAFYNKGQQFPQLIGNNIDITLSSVLFPAMSNNSDNITKVKTMEKRSLKVSSYVIFPLLAFLAAISKNLVIILLTEKWLQCVVFLKILSISQAIGTVSKTSIQSLKAVGRSDITLKLELIKKPIYLLILLFAVRKGVLAIAFSMMFYSIVGTFINMIPNVKVLKYPLKEQLLDLFPAFILSVIMYVLVTIIGNININVYLLLIIQTMFAVLFYITASVKLKLDSFFYIKEILMNILGGRRNDK